MATLIQQTKWDQDDDGSPHKAYFSTLNDGVVASPYYRDGRNVPVNGHTTTKVPVTDLVPGAAIGVAGPAALVTGTVTGVIPTGTSLSYSMSGPSIGAFGGSLPQNGPLVTAAEWAEQLASGLNAKHGDVITATAVITDDLTAQVDIVAFDGSNVTLASWTI